MALIGGATEHRWAWRVVFAVGLEVAMLFTPYPAFFHIPPSGNKPKHKGG